MRKIFFSNESGSSSFTALAALVALSMATLYVLNSTSQTAQTVGRARIEGDRINMRTSTLNVLAQYKALIQSKAVGTGHQPVLYPLNYFNGSWVLAKNDAIPTTTVTDIKEGTVSLKTVQAEPKLDADTQAILGGTSAFAKNLDVQQVRFIRANFNKTLATSVDVEVTSVSSNNISQTTRARIPVPVPDAYNPIIEYSPAGANAWTRTPGVLTGSQDIRVLGSGVVTVAKVYIGNTGPFELGGFDKTTGLIKHQATNVMAKDVEIGRMTHDFDAGTTTSYEYFVTDPVTSCKATPTFSSADIDIRVELINPAETVSTNGTFEQKVKAKSSGTASAPAPPVLSFEDVNKTCEKECEYIYPTDPADEGKPYQAQVDAYRAQQFMAKKFTDYAWGYMRHIRDITGVFDTKICENISKSYDAVVADNGPNPTNPGLIFSYWKDLQYVYYRAPACTRHLLFTRAECGCFQEDTQITLGDGRSTKSIQDLVDSDLIWNPILQKAQPIKRMTRGPEALPLLRISSLSASVSVTGGHPFPTRDGSFKQAFALEVGEEVLINDRWEKIQDIAAEKAAEKPIVWNLELAGHEGKDGHYVLANGIVTGDLKIQEKLGSE